jgi:hypothetical protein
MPDRRLVRIAAVAAAACFYAGLAAVGGDAAFSGNDRVEAGGAGALDAGGIGIASGAGDTGAGAPGSPASGSEAPEPGSAGAQGRTGSAAGGPGGPGAAGPQPPAAGPVTPGTPAGGGTPVAAGGTIAIGVHDDNPGAAFGQFGVQGGPSSDQTVWIRAIVDWINANGGMGGRQVELVHHVTESLNGSFDQQAERACADFAEDHDVVAVVSGARVPSLNLVDCLAGHDTPLVWNFHFMADRAVFDQYPDHLYMPSMVSADRLGVWIDAVAGTGFFDGGTVGVVRFDSPIHDRFSANVLAPALARHGSAITEEVGFNGASAAASAADLSAQANNAVLRFRSRGVDRVVFVPTSAIVPLLFFPAAEAQGFRPRYTLTTYDNPAFQDANAESFPAQLAGSLAFGWTPAGDVDWEQQPQPLPPAAQLCLDITQGAEPTGTSSVRRYCDGLFFLKHLFDGGAEPTTAGLRRAVESLGTSFPSAWTFAAGFGPGRHDGPTSGRLLAYDLEGCECYQYTGPEVPIP